MLYKIKSLYFKIIGFFVRMNREACIEALGREYNLKARFSVLEIAVDIKGFEDLYFLFWPSPLNRGLIRMDLDEAAYLYKAIRSLNKPFGVEIGRFKGGSTVLLAAAVGSGKLLSLDMHVKMSLKKEGANLDKELEAALEKAGLRNLVDIVVSDSRSYDNKNISVDFILIDGDHTYSGVKADYEHWIGQLKKGGHIFFHDAVKTRSFTTIHEGVYKFVNELTSDTRVKKIKNIGSLAHFVKVN